MGRLIPLILGLVGLAGGAGAGLMLRPAADPAAKGGEESAAAGAGDKAGEDQAAEAGGKQAGEGKGDEKAGKGDGGEGAGKGGGAEGAGEGDPAVPDYVKLSNQFVVPVVEDGRVSAMVILSLSLEVAPGTTEAVYAREPRLRDTFLQVLFDHANAGGFRGAFTDGANLILLRRALREAGTAVLGEDLREVLISDIVRQDG